MAEDVPRPGPFEVVRLKEFRLYIIQRFFFIMAMRMVTTLVWWKMYLITKNPLALAFISLSEAIPAILLALYSGHIVDRSDKRNMLVRNVLLYGVCAAGLMVATNDQVGEHFGNHFVQFAIYGVIFCTGILRSFIGPTSSSIMSQLVPRTLLPNAVTWSSSVWMSGSVIGHATAGFMIAHAGYTPSFVLILVYLGIAATCAYAISHKPILHGNTTQRTWDSVKEGLQYVVKTKELLGAISLDLFAVLFGGAVAMIPFFADQILKVGPIGFGWLNAAADIGSITTVLLLTLFPLRRNQGRIMMLAVAGFGICIILFGLSKIYLLSFFALLCSGALDGVSVVIRGTILQLKTPDEMRGRVSSVNTMFISSSNEIGSFESGVAAKLMGVVNSVIFGGSMTLLVVIITWLKAPKLRKFEY
ncbi:MAG: MFS transporter [Candidatus Pseudobacter hemicellulosilyticus]|uniref:MFS transporter n=1 Tax=Candidatus Pseudobacter hemicellulosilyticus TaxID=3121375 RepID=A0AAJ5WVW0_9BACT|nr:MAG: MFS transporter [Pseudobacter sp.]